jgi:molybdopterin-guanine dinucleotide biosynthesis protein A
MSAPIHGLLLTGGHSRRMQRDKATLEYHGQSQLARAVALLQPLVSRCFLSVRAEQQHDPLRAAHALIVDRLPGLGPLGGIHAALHAHPEAAWLVLAVDLPFLDAATLQQLIAAREPARLGTAFRSSFDGKPEPLCALWEPASAPAVDAWIAAGRQCPREFMAQHDVALLTLRNPRALDNINTSAEYLQARSALAGADAAAGSGGETSAAASAAAAAPPTPISLRVQYFAALRDQAGRSEETVATQARTPLALYQELRVARRLQLRPEQLRVAVNEDFADWSRPLRSGDSVVFLPPVAGG